MRNILNFNLSSRILETQEFILSSHVSAM